MIDTLNDDELAQLVPLPVGDTRLVTDATDSVVYTLRRSTDCRTAITRALAEYVASLEIDLDQRDVRFVQVLETWSEPEVPAAYPAAVVYGSGPGTYDASKLTPRTFEIPGSEGQSVRFTCEFTMEVTLEVWANDPHERMALVAMLEDALDPVEWMSGMRLEAPHYHGARITFEKLSLSYEDDASEAIRGWRRAIFVLNASIPQIKMVGRLPRMKPRFIADVSGSGEPS